MQKVMSNLLLFVLFIFPSGGTNTVTVNASTLIFPLNMQAEDSRFINHFRGFDMRKNKDPSDNEFLFGDMDSHFKSLEPDEELLALEKELRQRNLLYDPDVQWLIDGGQETSSSCSSNRIAFKIYEQRMFTDPWLQWNCCRKATCICSIRLMEPPGWYR